MRTTRIGQPSRRHAARSGSPTHRQPLEDGVLTPRTSLIFAPSPAHSIRLIERKLAGQVSFEF